MADDVRLSARLWMPERAESERLPAVLELIPYRKRDGYRDVDDAWGAVLAAAGIVFARVDVRGTGDSEGVLTDEYSEAELADGETCIAWLAAQPWCNGNVGMRGISWGGINTLMIAARRPPALNAIVPMAASANRFTDDAHYIGGRIGKPNLDWGVLFKTVLAGPPDPEVVGDAWETMWQARLAATPAVVTEWLRHQRFDDYWQRGSLCLDPTAIDCPVYLVAGWQDTYLNFISSLLSELTVPARALIGPWGHTYPNLARPQSMDWAAEEVAFWRRWLLGDEDDDDGGRLRARVHVFLPEQTARQCHPEPIPGAWRSLDGLPQTRRVFRLAGGALIVKGTTAASSVEQKTILWAETEPVGFNTAEWLDRLPEEQSRDDALSLCFDTEPLTEPLTLLGRATLTLGNSEVTGPVLTVRLCDVDEHDRSWLVSYASLDTDNSVTFRLAGHVFKPGHRLRLAISGGLWPMTWPAEQPLSLALDTESCRFELPVLQDPVGASSLVEEKVRKVAPPEALPEIVRTDSGGYRYEVTQPAYEYEVKSVGTRLSGEGEFIAELGPGGQSRWEVSARRGWQRLEWDCAVEATVTLERVANGLQVAESLKAYQADRLVFEQESTELVPDQ